MKFIKIFLASSIVEFEHERRLYHEALNIQRKLTAKNPKAYTAFLEDALLQYGIYNRLALKHPRIYISEKARGFLRSCQADGPPGRK